MNCTVTTEFRNTGRFIVEDKYNGKNQTKKIELMVEEESGEQLYMKPIHNILYCR
jgi:ribosomal protein L20A (L18A)